MHAIDVLLLERIPKLGGMGEVVRVKPGFARNWLLPQGKALRANEANRRRFEAERHILERRDSERRAEAELIADELLERSFVIIRAAGESGQMYGSVTARDIIDVFSSEGLDLKRNQVELNDPIKAVGLYHVTIRLHPDVEVMVQLNVARSAEEAQRQASGELLTSAEAIFGFDEDALDPNDFFEPTWPPPGQVPVDDQAPGDEPSKLTDTKLSISSIITLFHSPDLGVRLKAMGEASQLLLSLERGNVMQVSKPHHETSADQFEAYVLPERLYERMFSAEAKEARAAAYALILSTPDYRGQLDPKASPEKLNKRQANQFRSGLLRLFSDIGVHYISYIDAASIGQMAGGKQRIHVFVKVSRRLPFDIAGESLFLDEASIEDPRLRITSPFALDIIEHTEVTESSASPEAGIITSATADIIVSSSRLPDAGELPITVSFNRAIETIDIPIQSRPQTRGDATTPAS